MRVFTVGLLQTRKDALGKTTTYSYNSHSQITGVDYPNDPDISYTYNADGTLASVTDAVGTTSFTYDSSGRVATEDGPFANDTITNSYDDFDRLVNFSQTATDGPLTTSYTYDALNRIVSLTSDLGSLTSVHSYSYTGTSNQVAQLKRNTKTVVANTYDPLNRLTLKQNLDMTGNVLSSFALEYDNSDEIIKRTENSGKYSSYSYDNAGQLVSSGKFESDDSPLNLGANDYSYDAMGNRTSSDFLSPSGTHNPISYNTNNLNQYTAMFAPDGSASTPSYDANGNMTQFQCSTGFQPVLLSLQYNDENRLISVSPALPVSGSLKSEFLYDFMGRRRIKKVFSYDGFNWTLVSETKFIYRGWNLIERRVDAGGTISTTNYTWGLGTGGVGALLQVAKASGTYFPQYDNNGNIVSYTDENDNIVAEYTYSPFGKIVEQSGSMADEFLHRFSTKQFDSETGLVYYGYRYYSPELGRWLSRDPIGEAGGLNLYGFVYNSPLNYIDDSGEFVGTLAVFGIVAVALLLSPDTAVAPEPLDDNEYPSTGAMDMTVGILMIPLFDIGGKVISSGARKSCNFLGGIIKKAPKSRAAIRNAYNSHIPKWRRYADTTLKRGASPEHVARRLSKARRLAGIRYKKMGSFLDRMNMYYRNRAPTWFPKVKFAGEWVPPKGYDSIYGPSVNWLRNSGKSWHDIIESALRPNQAVNKFYGVK